MSRLRASRDERGSTAISFILAFPLFFFLLIGILETGWNVRQRALVQGIARDITRGAAADGGDCNPDTTSQNIVTPGDDNCDGAGHASWSRIGYDALVNKNRHQYTSMTWSATGGDVFCDSDLSTPGMQDIAPRAGARIRCTVIYRYKPLTSLFSGSGRYDLGLPVILGTFRVSYTARAETGAGA